jgi:hypothetical protein
MIMENSSKLFVQHDGQHYSLPSFKMEGGLWETSAAKVQPGFQQIIGDDLNVLYRAAYKEEPATKQAESLYVLEAAADSSYGGSWLNTMS